MSDIDTIKVQIQDIQQKTADVLTELTEKANHLALAPLPGAIEEYIQKISSNAYTVLVVGEAKRGKSSFVNALIGRELLPTDVDIATNQVFRITNASQEVYRLRFDDGSTQNITAAELLEYGSQTIADQRKITHLDLEHLHWIELEIPVLFLPDGVSLLDTPGMGSLYAAHAQITQRFVPHADAVIYVLDSSQPVTQFELQFIETILQATSHIFFIQTKIDQYDKTDWQRVMQRHEVILHDHFKEKLSDVRIWPVSSSNLLKAVKNNNQALLKVSHKQELLDALEIFLFKVGGWNRCVGGLQTASHYYTTTKQLLASQETLLRTQSTEDFAHLHQASLQRSKEVEADWGISGKKRRDLKAQMQRITNAGKTSIIQLLSARGPLEANERVSIDAVQSLEEANDLGTRMFEDITTETLDRWHEICEQSREQCAALIGSVIEATDELLLSPESAGLTIHTVPIPDIHDDMQNKVMQAQSGFFLGSTLGFILIANIPFLWPVAPIAIGATGIWTAMHYWKQSEATQLKDAKQKLQEMLSSIMYDVHQRFLQPDTAYEGQSLVSRYFELLQQSMNEQMEELVERKLEEVKREGVLLEEQVTSSKQQREKKLHELQQQLIEWDALGHSITVVTTAMKTLEPVIATIVGK